MALSGIVHIVYGIAGISTQDWYAYTSTGAYVFSLTTWGWTMLTVGILLILSALLLLSGNIIGRVMGTILALGSVLFNIALIGAAPFWSILAIVINLLIIYAIVVHGSEMKRHQP